MKRSNVIPVFRQPVIKKERKNWELFICAVPLMLIVFLFNYVPLFGWVLGFLDYKVGRNIFNCDFVGLKFFEMFLTDRDVLRVLKNTVILSSLGFLLMPLPVIFAVCLNEIGSSKFRKITQTLTTLPHFISWIIVYAIAFAMFSTEGLVNNAYAAIGSDKMTALLTDKGAVYWFQTALTQWKSLGWSAIIYFAAIAGLDQELYQAAKIDGAGRFRSAIYITIPGVMPTFIVIFLLHIANFANTGFEQYFVFQNPVVYSNIEVLDLYIYKKGLQLFDYSYATAVGILKSLFSIGLLFCMNALARKFRGSNIF